MPGIEKTMHEFKAGTLHSSSGSPVTSRAQAIAIGLSEERRGKKRKKRGRNSGEIAGMLKKHWGGNNG